MAKATGKKTKKKTIKNPSRGSASAGLKPAASVMGFPLKAWIEEARAPRAGELKAGSRAFVFVFDSSIDKKAAVQLLKPHLNEWQLASLQNGKSESQSFQGRDGLVWLLRPEQPKLSRSALEKSKFARCRDLAGALVPTLLSAEIDKLIIEMHGLAVHEEQAVLLGLELAAYSYAENRPAAPKARRKRAQILLAESRLSQRDIQSIAELAISVNLARHYTNLPGGDLNPRTYAESVRDLFAKSSLVKVDVWSDEKLKAERMNLLLAVGAAAHEGPRLVHLRYRPKNKIAGVKPVAIVGKGVTFDTGGLDIKPSSAMRWMKKDMGGSAAAVAIVKWAEKTGFPIPMDVYLSLAENAVGSRSFRPGDIIVARNGQTVEIGNTDAEGRLVMADALDLAVSQKGDDHPQAVIDIATLTGAIKVGLGTEIAGLFSNSDHLAGLFEEAGWERGDLMWRMPLYEPYRSHLRSNAADTSNCSDSGFGGAITAALFLAPYVKDVPWVHLDVYSWKDSAGGAWSESGGNGQPVQALALMLERLAEENTGAEIG